VGIHISLCTGATDQTGVWPGDSSYSRSCVDNAGDPQVQGMWTDVGMDAAAFESLAWDYGAEVYAGLEAVCAQTDCEADYGFTLAGGPASGLPELTLEGGALIAGAIAALWATAWAFRVIRNQLKED